MKRHQRIVCEPCCLTMFAATAISLACIGLYGTLSYLGRLSASARLVFGWHWEQCAAKSLRVS